MVSSTRPPLRIPFAAARRIVFRWCAWAKLPCALPKDTLYAQWLQAELRGEQPDFDLCLDPGRFPFVLCAQEENGLRTLRRADVDVWHLTSRQNSRATGETINRWA
jgi:hypothetical protein